MSRSSDTWFKFYVDDWIDATRDLTLEQRGAYIDTLAFQYRDGKPLVDDMQKLAHRLHVSKRKADAVYTELCDALRLMREERDGKRVIFDERAQVELEARAEQRQTAAVDGGKGGRPKNESKPAQPQVETGSAPDQGRADAGPSTSQSRAEADPTSSQSRLDAEIKKTSNEINVSEKGTLSEPGETRAQLKKEEKKKEELERIPPTPQGGKPGQELASPEVQEGETADQRRRTTDAAFDLWNAFANEHGMGRIEMRSDKRRTTLHRRIKSLGGLENFQLALAQVTKNDFLMGRESPRQGNTPFRLTLESLLSTGSGMGDVLARIVDDALAQKPAAPTSSKTSSPKENWWVGKDPDAFRRASEAGWVDLINTWAHGFWPVKYLGPPPGSPDCIVNPDVIVSENLIERFGAPEKHVN